MTEPFWLSAARMMQGISEIPGEQSNPIILRWAKEIGAPNYTNDDIAWCAVFMNRLMMAAQLPLSGQSYDLLRAASFMKWGIEMLSRAPGAVMVFSRSEGSHVGLYLCERDDAFLILGGNTANSVSSAWLLKSRLLAIRWPAGVPMPQSKIVSLTSSANVSTNEA